MELSLGMQLLIFIGSFVGSCVLFRIPVAFGMGIGALGLIFANGLPFTQFLQAAFTSLDSFTYLAIPLFVLSGSFMEHSGIASMLIDWAEALIGKVRGGIGAICTVACAAFGMLTGSATSTLSSIGKIMIGEMKKRGYSDSYAGALAAATGFLFAREFISQVVLGFAGYEAALYESYPVNLYWLNGGNNGPDNGLMMTVILLTLVALMVRKRKIGPIIKPVHEKKEK